MNENYGISTEKKYKKLRKKVTEDPSSSSRKHVELANLFDDDVEEHAGADTDETASHRVVEQSASRDSDDDDDLMDISSSDRNLAGFVSLFHLYKLSNCPPKTQRHLNCYQPPKYPGNPAKYSSSIYNTVCIQVC